MKESTEGRATEEMMRAKCTYVHVGQTKLYSSIVTCAIPMYAHYGWAGTIPT